FDAVRGGLVRDALHDGADAGVQPDLIRKTRLGHGTPAPAKDAGTPGDGGNNTLHATPVLARWALLDRVDEAGPPVVLAVDTSVLLDLSRGRRTGDGHG